jgi:peptidoglycan hydrolase-like protein with peptidoglycan-binding domain
MDKNFYNQSSATSLGWSPNWFGEKHYDEKLVRAIKRFQKSYGLKPDGMCGPTTFRRLWTERQENIDEHIPKDLNYSKYIVHNGNFTPIEWDKFVLWSERGGQEARQGSYYDYSGRPERKPRLFVNHWDVCLSSTQCQKVLDKRGISVHFLIDNDGTIYQTLDLQHAAFHAGNVNRKSVGVEISNAYYPKYQSTYVKRGFGERPVIEDGWVHGNKLDPFLGFYPVQLEALKALWASVNKALDIPLQTPLSQFGTTSKHYEQDAAYGKYSGFVSHYHVSKKKIDCAGLDIKTLIEEIE